MSNCDSGKEVASEAQPIYRLEDKLYQNDSPRWDQVDSEAEGDESGHKEKACLGEVHVIQEINEDC